MGFYFLLLVFLILLSWGTISYYVELRLNLKERENEYVIASSANGLSFSFKITLALLAVIIFVIVIDMIDFIGINQVGVWQSYSNKVDGHYIKGSQFILHRPFSELHTFSLSPKKGQVETTYQTKSGHTVKIDTSLVLSLQAGATPSLVKANLDEDGLFKMATSATSNAILSLVAQSGTVCPDNKSLKGLSRDINLDLERSLNYEGDVYHVDYVGVSSCQEAQHIEHVTVE